LVLRGRTDSVTKLMVAFHIFVKKSETEGYTSIYIHIYIEYIINCNWVDTRWQQYSTHIHTNRTQNTENGTYITIKRKKIGKSGPCPVFASYTLAIALQLKKKHGKPSVTVVEKCPDYTQTVHRIHRTEHI
jgi:hypothetical protein